MDWNYADILDATARAVPPDRQALIWGEESLAWPLFDRRTNRVARAMIESGLVPGEPVAILCRNHPSYIETMVGCLKARLITANINFRYTAEEIAYVVDDCRAAAFVYQDSFDNLAEALKTMLPSVRVWIRIETDRTPMPVCTALSFEALASTGDGSPLGIRRSPDDGYLQYTGGTTGRPKGVLWPTSQSRLTQLESPLLVKAPTSLEEHAEMVRGNPLPSRTIPASPLMHGSGSNAAIGDLLNGGSIILLGRDRFDPHELWSAAQRHRATRVALVGDVFARSLLRALGEPSEPYNLASLRLITSSGLTWSREVREGLLAYLPDIILLDILAASEAAGLGYAISRLGDVPPTGLFKAGKHTRLVDPDSFEILPVAESSEGLIARDGAMATGYFGDTAKTAATFRIIDGKRYAIPGDVARWVPPDHLMMIGRGNLCINSGGEKVFPEEVEEALKMLPGIEDAIVIGCPDETWGRVVVAIIKTSIAFDEAEIRRGLSQRLAAYKHPKRFILVTEMPRHETGKVDYQKAQTLG